MLLIGNLIVVRIIIMVIRLVCGMFVVLIEVVVVVILKVKIERFVVNN